MLSITNIAAGDAGKDFRAYVISELGGGDDAASAGSYYSKESDKSVWLGARAAEFGLTGAVTEEQLLDMMNEIVPMADGSANDNHELLGQMTKKVDIAAYDFTFSAPKSVSVLWGLTADEGVRTACDDAHNKAVAKAIAYMEAEVANVRRSGQGSVKLSTTGLMAAAVNHRTSRALDPQMHSHVIISAWTEGADGKVTTVDASRMYHLAKIVGSVYQAELRSSLSADLGVDWGQRRNGLAEIEGIDQEVLGLFSKRTQEMKEKLAEDLGKSAGDVNLSDLEFKQASWLALNTRAPKGDEVKSTNDLNVLWRDEAAAIRELEGKEEFDLDEMLNSALNIPEALEYGIQPGRVEMTDEEFHERAEWLAGPMGLTAQQAHFNRKDVLEAWFDCAPSGLDAEEIIKAADRFLDETVGAGYGVVPVKEGLESKDEFWRDRVLFRDDLERRGFTRTGIDEALKRFDVSWEPSAKIAEREALVQQLSEAGEPQENVETLVSNFNINWKPTEVEGKKTNEWEAARYSTAEVIGLEERILAHVAVGFDRGDCGLVPEEVMLDLLQQENYQQLGGSQLHALRDLLLLGREFTVMPGPAGAGKTTLLACAVEAWQSQGKTVIGGTLAAKTAKELGEGTGMDYSGTLVQLVGRLSGDGYLPMAARSSEPFDVAAAEARIMEEARAKNMKTQAKIAELKEENASLFKPSTKSLAKLKGQLINLPSEPFEFDAEAAYEAYVDKEFKRSSVGRKITKKTKEAAEAKKKGFNEHDVTSQIKKDLEAKGKKPSRTLVKNRLEKAKQRHQDLLAYDPFNETVRAKRAQQKSDAQKREIIKKEYEQARRKHSPYVASRLKSAEEDHKEGATVNTKVEWGPDTVLLLDEIGMVGTRHLAQLLEMAEGTGTKIVLSGDDRQLQAIDAGGMLMAIKEQIGGVAELKETWRAVAAWERETQLQYRSGSEEEADAALEQYKKQGRVSVFSDRKAALNTVVDAAWRDAHVELLEKYEDELAAMDEGELEEVNKQRVLDGLAPLIKKSEDDRSVVDNRTVLILSQSRADAIEMNEMFRARRIEAGEIHPNQSGERYVEAVNERTGQWEKWTMSTGDQILVTKTTTIYKKSTSQKIGDKVTNAANAFNHEVLGVDTPETRKTGEMHRVNNGEVGTIHAVHDNGDVSIKLPALEGRKRSRIFRFPAEDVDEGRIALGYAYTGHKAQGVTVTASHVLASSRSHRQWLYSTMTRGKENNSLYFLDGTFEEERFRLKDHIPLNDDGSVPKVDAATRRLYEEQHKQEQAAARIQHVDDQLKRTWLKDAVELTASGMLGDLKPTQDELDEAIYEETANAEREGRVVSDANIATYAERLALQRTEAGSEERKWRQYVVEQGLTTAEAPEPQFERYVDAAEEDASVEASMAQGQVLSL